MSAESPDPVLDSLAADRAVTHDSMLAAEILGQSSINNIFPAEIFLKIFHDIASSTQCVLNNTPVQLLPCHWLRVTHVCRHWRVLAIDDPTLWQHIETTDPQCIEAFLSRSKRLQLYVTIPSTTYFIDEFPLALQSILREIHRVAEIHLFHEPLCLQFLAHPLSGNLPCLQTLELDGKPDRPRIPSFLHSAAFESYKGKFPTLKSLTLTGLHPRHFFLSASPMLRTLRITRPTIGITPDTWMTVLRTLPALQELHLHTAVSTQSAEPHNSPRGQARVHLPNLRAISLQGNGTTSGERMLLRMLSIPANAALFVHFGNVLSPALAEETILAAKGILPASGQRDTPPNFLVSQSNTITTISLYTTEMTDTWSGCSETAVRRRTLHPSYDAGDRFFLSFNNRCNQVLAPQIRRLLSSAYSLSKIHTLCVADYRQARGPPHHIVPLIDPYWQMFAAMTDLRMLSLSCTFLVDFARSLLSAGSVDGLHHIYPHLTRLAVGSSGEAEGKPASREPVALRDLIPLLPREETLAQAFDRIHICDVDVASTARFLRKWTKADVETCEIRDKTKATTLSYMLTPGL